MLVKGATGVSWVIIDSGNGFLATMATIQITHFDQLGTICNDYSEEYRITGA